MSKHSMAARAAALQRLRESLAARRATIASLAKDFNPNQPRDADGRFTDGSGMDAANEPAPESSPGQQSFMDDDGKPWNDAGSPEKILMKRSAKAIARADEILQAGIEAGDSVATGPASWEDIEEDAKSEAQNQWENDNLQKYVDEEMESYVQDLKRDTLSDVEGDEEFAKDVFVRWATDNGFTEDSAREAFLGIHKDVPDVDVDVLRLEGQDEAQEDGVDDTAAQAAAGDKFDKLANDLDTHYKEAVETEAEARVESALEDGTPDHIYESAQEAVSDEWSNLSDSEKLEAAGIDAADSTELSEPDQYAVLDSSDRGYAETRAVVRYIQSKVMEEELEKRGIANADKVDVDGVAKEIWSEWKSSSTTDIGLLLQHATALELGARERMTQEQQNAALRGAVALDKQNGGRGDWERGIEIAKAHVYATWAASQHALEKAGITELATYRGIMWNGNELEGEQVDQIPNGLNNPFEKISSLQIERNGAASFTTDSSIANSWGGVGKLPPNPTRVVLRVMAPRASVLSLPVFGQNVHSEQEVVLAGTKWKSWDAFKGRAPDHDRVEIKSAPQAI